MLRGEGTTLFTVGDEMQAIYGFRYADVELYRQRRAGISFRLPADAERRAAGERDRVTFEVTTLPLSCPPCPASHRVNELGNQFESLIEGHQGPTMNRARLVAPATSSSISGLCWSPLVPAGLAGLPIRRSRSF